jgi:hypothetical protein
METLTLYGEDGTQYRAVVHQERIDTSSMDGVGSIPGMQTIRLQEWNSVELRGQRDIQERTKKGR